MYQSDWDSEDKTAGKASQSNSGYQILELVQSRI